MTERPTIHADEIREAIQGRTDKSTQIHVNHKGCPAGADTRQRLYVSSSTKQQGWVAYCHNCGGWGTLHSTGTYKKQHNDTLRATMQRVAQASDGGSDDGFFTQLAGYHIMLTHTPGAHYVRWLERAHLTPEQAEEWGIVETMIERHGDYYSVAFIPYGLTDGSAGYQIRRLEKECPMPKYLTYKSKCALDTFIPAIWTGQAHDPMLVIVEDLLSGIRIAQAGRDAYVMAGTHPDLQAVAAYLAHAGIKHVCVWLDNDGEQISKKADSIRDFCELLGVSATRVMILSDPKLFNVPEVCDTLTGQATNTGVVT